MVSARSRPMPERRLARSVPTRSARPSGRTEELFGAGEIAGERAGVEHAYARKRCMKRREQTAMKLGRVGRDDRERDRVSHTATVARSARVPRSASEPSSEVTQKRARSVVCARPPRTTIPPSDRIDVPRDAFEDERRDRDTSSTLARHDKESGGRSAYRGQRRREVIDIHPAERGVADVDDDEAEAFAAQRRGCRERESRAARANDDEAVEIHIRTLRGERIERRRRIDPGDHPALRLRGGGRTKGELELAHARRTDERDRLAGDKPPPMTRSSDDLVAMTSSLRWRSLVPPRASACTPKRPSMRAIASASPLAATSLPLNVREPSVSAQCWPHLDC